MKQGEKLTARRLVLPLLPRRRQLHLEEVAGLAGRGDVRPRPFLDHIAAKLLRSISETVAIERTSASAPYESGKTCDRPATAATKSRRVRGEHFVVG